MSAFTITPATAADMPRVRTLAYAIWPEAYAGVIDADLIPPMLAEIYDLATLEADITERSHTYWMATGTDGTDLGFASAYAADGRVWIKKLYVLDAARGLGLGKALIATARAYFGTALSAALYVNSGNKPAISFYERQGFTIEAAVPVRMGPFDFTDYVMVSAAPAR